MKKTIRLCVYICLFLHVLFLNAQSDIPPLSSSLTPSANAAELGQFGNVPVNLFNGTANISVPIYTLKSNHLTMPIGLNYNTSGVRVRQMASTVGLGWSLNAGGVITRKVNGLPDDVYRVLNAGSNVGYLYEQNRSSQDVQYFYDTHPTDLSIIDDIELLAGRNGAIDLEPDIFYFNINGIAGKFVFDEMGVPKLLEESDVKIEYEISQTINPLDDFPITGLENDLSIGTNYRGGITAFTITGPNGVQYVFRDKEISLSQTKGINHNFIEDCQSPLPYGIQYYDFSEAPVSYSSWFLSEIISPIGEKNFTFSYTDGFLMDNSVISQRSMVVTDLTPSPVNIQGVFTESTYSLVFTKQLQEIKWGHMVDFGIPYGKVHFIYSEDREDLYYQTDQFTSDYSEYYYKGLTNIQIRNGNGGILKDFMLGYSFLSGIHCTNSDEIVETYSKRLCLSTITERGRNENGGIISLPPYTLSYNETPLPPRYSAHQDYWGYYNGTTGKGYFVPNTYAYPEDVEGNAQYQTVFSVYPRTNYTGIQHNLSFFRSAWGPSSDTGDRSPNEASMQAGILKSITYPTGGSTAFTYEANRFTFDSQTFLGGGLRVKQIVHSTNESDVGYGTASLSNDIVQEYSYEDGRVIDMPHFFDFNTDYYVEGEPFSNLDVNGYSYSISGLGGISGAPVGYRTVETKLVNGSKVKHNFNIPIYYGVEEAFCNGTDCAYKRSFTQNNESQGSSMNKFPFPINPNNDWINGQLDRKTSYNEDGNIIEETQYTYSLENFSKVLGVKPHATRDVTYLDANGNPAYLVEDKVNIGKYYFLVTNLKLQKINTTTYGEAGNSMQSETRFEYNGDHHLATAIETRNIVQDIVHRQEIRYPQDLQGVAGWDQSVLDCLIDNYRINIPLEQIKYISGQEKERKQTIYAIFNGLGPTTDGFSFCMPKYFKTSGADGSLRTEKVINQYHYMGFPSRVTISGFAPLRYTWSIAGLLSEKRYLDQLWSYGYTNRQLSSATDPNNQTIEYEYDGFQRLQKKTTKNGAVSTSYTYQLGGLYQNFIKSTTDFGDSANGTETTESIRWLDGLGRYSKTEALGHTPSKGNIVINKTAYDGMGRAFYNYDYRTGVTITGFDNSALSRVKSINPPGVGSIGTRYLVNTETVKNYLGPDYAPGTLSKVESTDENGNVTTRYQDMLGQVIMMKNALGEKTHYAYDIYNRLRYIVPAGADGITHPASYSYTYDNWHRMKEKTIPGGSAIKYIYNGKDQVVLEQDGKLAAEDKYLCSVYDDYGRVIKTGFFTGDPMVTSNPVPDADKVLTMITYDTGTSGASIGKVTISKARVLHEDFAQEQFLTTKSYYDGYGRVHRTDTEDYLGGTNISHIVYDNADKVLSTTSDHQGATQIQQLYSYQYDHAGRAKRTYHGIAEGASAPLTANTVLNENRYNYRDQLIEKNLGVVNSNYLQSIDYGYTSRGWLRYINQLNPRQYGAVIPSCEEPEILGPCHKCSKTEPGPVIINPEIGKQAEQYVRNLNVQVKYNKAQLNNGESSPVKLQYTYELTDGKNTQAMAEEEVIAIDEYAGTPMYTDSFLISIPTPKITQNTYPATEATLKEALLTNWSSNEVKNEAVILKLNEEVSKRTKKNIPTKFPEYDGDIFAMELHHYQADAAFGADIKPQYNGNISQIMWQVRGRDKQTYAFIYDKINRLEKAHYADVIISNYTNDDKYGVPQITYDERGNIQQLNRRGVLSSCGTAQSFGMIDMLGYGYDDNNHLNSVTDEASGTKGYKYQSSGGTYGYDVNGNVTQDPNRNIGNIEYNYLNLPTRISISGEDKEITWLYDAAGNRLRMQVNSVSGTFTKDYMGSIEYSNGEIESIYTSEGRIIPKNGDFSYEYKIQDHLGNIRVMFADLNNNGVIETANDQSNYTEIIQEHHYYPFGLNHEGPFAPIVAPKVAYQYNGIELVDQLGFDLNHATYRTLDPSLGRWLQVDPEAERFYNFTPYNSMGNNPINNIDPNGDLFKAEGLIVSALGIVSNAVGGKYKDNSGQILFDLVGGLLGSMIADYGKVNLLDIKLGSFGEFGLFPRFNVGSDDIGVGLEAGVSLGFGKVRVFESYVGGNLHFSAVGTNRRGVEGYAGYGFGAMYQKSETQKYGLLLRSTTFFSGETSQKVGGLEAVIGKFNLTYENDGVPFGSLGLGDGGDSFRTSSASIGWGEAKAGINLFTGKRIYDDDTGTTIGYPYGVATRNGVDKYRAGIFYLGYKGARIGWNGERVRHIFQNILAHDLIKPQPWIRVLPQEYNGLYFSYGNRSNYHTW